MKPDVVWQAALGELQLQMTQATFDTWLCGSRFIEIDAGGAFVIGVKSGYAQDWLEHRLLATVKRTLTRLTGRPTDVRFVVVDGQPDQADEGPPGEGPTDRDAEGPPTADALAPPTPAFVLPDYDVHDAGWFPISAYEDRFWAPLLGRVAWRVWEIVREADKRPKSRRTEWTPPRRWTAPALAAMVPCGRQALTGVDRSCEPGIPGAFEIAEGVWRVRQAGAFDRLQEEGVATIERRGRRPHVTYWISVKAKLGLLRPGQVSRLAARLQVQHDRWLADHGFEAREWDLS